MQETPSYLKGLAETRARAGGDVQRLLNVSLNEKLQPLATLIRFLSFASGTLLALHFLRG